SDRQCSLQQFGLPCQLFVRGPRRGDEAQVLLFDISRRSNVHSIEQRHKMSVHMRDVDAGKHETDTLHAMNMLHGLGKPLTQMHHAGSQLGWQVIEIGMMLPRDDEYVS